MNIKIFQRKYNILKLFSSFLANMIFAFLFALFKLLINYYTISKYTIKKNTCEFTIFELKNTYPLPKIDMNFHLLLGVQYFHYLEDYTSEHDTIKQ